jgi:hypothetical protein
MEKKTLDHNFNKPIEVTMSLRNSIVNDPNSVLDDLVLRYRVQIDDWLEPYYQQGWRLRYPLDRTIFKTSIKDKSNPYSNLKHFPLN